VSLWRVAVRPRWIAALVLALAVAGAFAALGQWQLERSIASGAIVERTTEVVVPLETIAEPQEPTHSASDGQLVTVTGEYVAGDFMLLEHRVNQGDTGYWVVGHLGTSEGDIAVALGWSETQKQAKDVLEALDKRAPFTDTVTGRYLPGEAPQESDFEGGRLTTLSPPALVNLWQSVADGGTYGGYIIAADAAAGLEAIDSPAPPAEIAVNWLNIFYAAEWVIFAGFAVFLWFRLVKDAWERETAEAAQPAQV
jgi:surfeit locus 1 family protein